MGQPAVPLTWHAVSVTDAATSVGGDPHVGGGVLLVESRQRGDARAVSVPHQAAAVSSARRAVLRDVLTKVDPTIVHETAVVVSELLGNAIRHARPVEDGRVLLRWQVRGGVVDVEVTDGGSGHEVRPLRPTAMSVHGRGPADRAAPRARVGRGRGRPGQPHRVGLPRRPVEATPEAPRSPRPHPLARSQLVSRDG